MDINKEHHIWCNHFTEPRDKCRMCRRLYKQFPNSDKLTPDELAKKYFPGILMKAVSNQ